MSIHFQHWAYAGSLLVGLAGMGALAWRIARSQVRALASVLVTALGFFLLWDIAGIRLGIFATNPAWVSGLFLGSANLPMEELA